MVGVAARVQDLQRDLAALPVHGVGDDAVLRHLPRERQLRGLGLEPAGEVGRDAARDDQPHAALRARRVEGRHPVCIDPISTRFLSFVNPRSRGSRRCGKVAMRSAVCRKQWELSRTLSSRRSRRLEARCGGAAQPCRPGRAGRCAQSMSISRIGKMRSCRVLGGMASAAGGDCGRGPARPSAAGGRSGHRALRADFGDLAVVPPRKERERGQGAEKREEHIGLRVPWVALRAEELLRPLPEGQCGRPLDRISISRASSAGTKPCMKCPILS